VEFELYAGGSADVYTEEMDGLLVGAERVGGDAVVSSVVVGVNVNNAQAERQPVVAVVVRLDAVLRRADDAPAVLLPVVDGVRERRYATLEDRLAAARLPQPRRRHRYHRRDCRPDKPRTRESSTG